MKLRAILGSGVLVAATALITAQVVSQDNVKTQEETAPGMDAEMMAKWQKYGTPNEHHKVLDPMVGNWNQTVTMWMYPGAEPEVTPTTATYEWILDGRFIKGSYTGEFGGMPFKGIDILGYDNFREEYRTVWLDNMSTSMMISHGEYNEKDKTITMIGTHDDVMTGEKNKKFKTVTRIIDNDHTVYESYSPGPDGDMFLHMKVESTRAK